MKQGRGRCAWTPQGAVPLGSPPRAEPLEPARWLGRGRGDWAGWVAALRAGDQPVRRAATQPAQSPLPRPNQNGWIPKALPLAGVQGGNAPLAGFRAAP
jgi:hypothetical protein